MDVRGPSDDPNLPIRARNSPTWDYYVQFLLKANSETVRPLVPQSISESHTSVTSRIKPTYTVTKDGLPGLLVHFQVTLRLDRFSTRTWQTPVEDFIIPFAPLPRVAPLSKGRFGIYNDGGISYRGLKGGMFFSVVQTNPSDPSTWVKRDDMKAQHINTATDLDLANDWVTPGKITQIDSNSFVQVMARLETAPAKGGAKQYLVQAVRLTRDPNAPPPEPDEDEDDIDNPPDLHLIPTSVLNDLVVFGGDPPMLQKKTVNWLNSTGWTYSFWTSAIPNWVQEPIDP